MASAYWMPVAPWVEGFMIAKVLIFFLFIGHGGHRDLSSFPTRRSSDLNRLMQVTARPGEIGVPLRHEGDRQPAAGAELLHRSGTPRSEEHTSELQSQFHLVCRLLLEQKTSSCRARRN